MKTKNKEVNECDGIKNKYIRTGKCNPQNCKSLCCRVLVHIVEPKSFFHEHADETFTYKKHLYAVYYHKCPQLIQGQCSLHNKKSQPRVCRLFPMTPQDKHYQYVKKLCTFKFKKKR